MTSVIKEFYWLYFTHSLLFGVGTSLMYTPCLVMVTRWFKKYQTWTTGIAVASSSLGAVTLSPTISHCVEHYGLRNTIRYGGVIYTILCVTCSLSYIPLHVKISKKKTKTDTQNEENEVSETADLKTKDFAISSSSQEDVEKYLPDEEECPEDVNCRNEDRHSFNLNFDLIKQPDYCLFLVIMMITNFTYYIPITYLVRSLPNFFVFDIIMLRFLFQQFL